MEWGKKSDREGRTWEEKEDIVKVANVSYWKFEKKSGKRNKGKHAGERQATGGKEEYKIDVSWAQD